MNDRKDLKNFVAVASVVFCGLLVPAVAAAGEQQTGVSAVSTIAAAETVPAVEAAAAPSVDAPLPRLKLPDNLFLVRVPGQGGVPKPGQTVKPPLAPTAKEFEKASFTKVLQYSVQLIFYEHVMRVAIQPFTRAELEGPFWEDYIRSVKMPKQWGDGDSWEVNYIGHSMHGSAAVRIWIAQREPDHLGKGKLHYWKAMGRAFLFAALFSEQFEIGPMSEASIGNVGLHEGRTGWVDHIITPFGSVLWTMYEDAVDKFVIRWIERKVPFNMAKVAARLILTPAWMLGNVAMNRLPWHRPDRPLTFVK